MIGRRHPGWIGTALYSPLLLMCANVCGCVHECACQADACQVMKCWRRDECASVPCRQGSVFFFEMCQREGRGECVSIGASVRKRACGGVGLGCMSRMRVIFVYSGVGQILMRCDTAYGECVRAGRCGLT